MKKTRLIPLLPALLFSLPALADEEKELQQLLSMSLEKLMTMTVSISTNTKQPLSKAPSVVSVITADDIRATGATDLMDVLQSVPGLYVRRNQFGFKPLISFRGAGGTASLLMINGDPIKDLLWTPGFFWKGVPANAIERIEIIRGPGSALYGSDASSGVINVVTKTAGKIPHSEAGVRLASFDTQAAWMQHGTEWNGFDINLTANISHTAGHAPLIEQDSQTARDTASGTNVSYAPGRAGYGWDGLDLRFSIAKENWRLLADHMSHDNVDIGLNGYGALDPRTRANDSQTSIALLYDNPEFAKNWRANAELRYRDMKYSSGEGFLERPPGFNCTNAVRYCNGGALGVYNDGLINQMQTAERRTSMEVSGLFTGFSKHAIRIGGGYVRQNPYYVKHLVNFGLDPNGLPLPLNGPLVDISGSPYAFSPEKARTNKYLFLQDVWTFANNWELTAGARYDQYSDFGNALTPRLALVWQATERLTAKMMYGEAFRAPTYLEMYADTAATNPNPNLKPEHSSTTELAFTYLASRDLTLGVNLFEYEQKDLIGLDATNTYQNISRQTTHGLELEAHWQAARTLKLYGNLTLHTHKNKDNIQRQVPNHQAYLRMDWQFRPKWNWNIQANWTGARTLAADDTRHLGNQAIVDTTIRYYHGSDWEFAASIRNLFDKDAREYTGTSIPNFLPLPRRNLFAEVRYKF